MKRYVIGSAMGLLMVGVAIVTVDKNLNGNTLGFVYDSNTKKRATSAGGEGNENLVLPTKATHLAGNPGYNAYFANFTTRYRLIDSPTTWEGRWKDTSLLPSDTLLKLRTNEGPSIARFSFEPGINKSWMNISIKEGNYFDSNSLELSINLKMSQFDKNTSTFTINCDQWDEYFAGGAIVENFYTISTRQYFDMSFQLSIKSRFSGRTIDLDNYQNEEVMVTYSLKSANLGLNLGAEMVYSQKTPTGSFLGLVYFVLLIFVFFASWGQNALFENTFITNMGFEVPGILMLLYYHMFCVCYQLLWLNSAHFLFLLGATSIMFICGFAWQFEAIHFMSIEDIQRRNRPRRAGGEIYTCLLFGSYMILVVLVAIFTPRLMMTSAHKYILLAFFSYPILQVIITLFKVVNKNVFKPGYQIFNWWPPLLYVACLRGGLMEEYTNLTPWPLLVPIAAGALFIGTFIMYLQHKISVFFFIPGFVIPKTTNYVVPISSVPQDKLEDLCPICYFRLSTDPEGAAGEGQGGQGDAIELQAGAGEGQRNNGEDIDRSNASESLMPRAMEAMKLQCGHYFHVPCLRAWFATKQMCPLCNQAVVYYDF